MGILDIPSELLLLIVEYLPIKDLFRFLFTCRRLSALLIPRLHKIGVQDVEVGLTALHWAAEYGHESLAKLAIRSGAEIDKPSQKLRGRTPLHSAAAKGHSMVIRVLAAHGANTAARFNYSQTPLHLASFYGRVEATRELLAHGADMMAVNTFGDTPAHSARGAHRCVKAIIDAGFDPNTRGRNGRTILHNAALYGTREMLEYVLGQMGGKMAINARDSDGATPLHLERSMENVRLLLRHGAERERGDENGDMGQGFWEYRRMFGPG